MISKYLLVFSQGIYINVSHIIVPTVIKPQDFKGANRGAAKPKIAMLLVPHVSTKSLNHHSTCWRDAKLFLYRALLSTFIHLLVVILVNLKTTFLNPPRGSLNTSRDSVNTPFKWSFWIPAKLFFNLIRCNTIATIVILAVSNVRNQNPPVIWVS